MNGRKCLWEVHQNLWTHCLLDVFPCHVETAVLLSKGVVDKDNFRKVKVDFSLEDMDLTELRGKTTYAHVKEYILNEFGLKVSSLYIAQVTPEKEETLMKAFRH